MGKRILSLGFGILFLISLVSAEIGEAGSHCDMMGSMSGAYGISWMLFGWVLTLLVTITLVLLIIWLIKQIQKK